MKLFENATNMDVLKHQYHLLAKRYHPDRGGSEDLMKKINAAYQQAKQGLGMQGKSLSELEAGDRVYVNGTACQIILVTTSKFVARAIGRSKQAWFDRSTGMGISNPLYRASLFP